MQNQISFQSFLISKKLPSAGCRVVYKETEFNDMLEKSANQILALSSIPSTKKQVNQTLFRL